MVLHLCISNIARRNIPATWNYLSIPFHPTAYSCLHGEVQSLLDYLRKKEMRLAHMCNLVHIWVILEPSFLCTILRVRANITCHFSFHRADRADTILRVQLLDGAWDPRCWMVSVTLDPTCLSGIPVTSGNWASSFLDGDSSCNSSTIWWVTFCWITRGSYDLWVKKKAHYDMARTRSSWSKSGRVSHGVSVWLSCDMLRLSWSGSAMGSHGSLQTQSWGHHFS